MTGSLHVKNNKYYMVVNIYEDGKRKQRWISTGLDAKGNKRNAERMLAEELTILEKKQGRAAISDTPFSDVVSEWLSTVRLSVDIVTYHGYEDIATHHVIPYFKNANIKVSDLKKNVIQRYINEKAESGRIDGKGGLSTSSLRLHKNVIFQSCKYAVDAEMIQANPCDGVVLPKKTRINYHYYSAAEVATLLDVAKDDVLFPLIKMTVVYGLRRSEVLGLRWNAIDFNEDLITINHTVTKVYQRVEKDTTKNKSSYRSYPLLAEIKDMLIRLKESEEKNKVDFGEAYVDSPYVFKWPNGVPFDPDYVTHHFSDLLSKNGLPHIRFHELRHSCASILIVSGLTLKDVQEWLGHSSIDMTADIYSHLDMQRKVGVGDKISGAILCKC